MRRNSLNFVVDFVTLLVMLGMISTGILIRYALPPKTGGRLAIWGMGRHDWGDIHFWFAAGLLALLLLHVALHWAWVCNVVRKMFPRAEGTKPARRWRRDMYGIATLMILAALIGGFQWIAVANVQESKDESGVRQGSQWQQQERSGSAAIDSAKRRSRSANVSQVNGAMTLVELADVSGLTFDQIKKELNLPDDTAADARLGKLRRAYGFKMSDARRLAEESER